MGVKLAPILIMAFGVVPISGSTTQPLRNAAAEALEWCRVAAANASTAGQTDSEASPVRSYRQLTDGAFAALMRWLPTAAGDRLRRSQWAWFAYHDADGATRSAFDATDEGTMFLPMEAQYAMTIVRNRAKLLERYTHTRDIA